MPLKAISSDTRTSRVEETKSDRATQATPALSGSNNSVNKPRKIMALA